MKWVAIIAAIVLLPVAVIAGLYFWRKSANKTPAEHRALGPAQGAAPQGAASPTNTGGHGELADTLKAATPIASKGLDILAQWVSAPSDDDGGDTEAA